MKKEFFILILTALFCACTIKQSTTNNDALTSDSLMLHILQAYMDTTKSILGVKSEYVQFVDTLLDHAQFHPDESVRIGAKSMAQLLSAFSLNEEIELNDEETTFFLDSIILKLAEVQSTWYYATPSKDSVVRPLLVQHVIKHESDDKNHITVLEVIVDSDDNRIVITLPDDAVSQPYIVFGGGNLNELDTIAFSEPEAIGILPRDDKGNYTICFDQRLIDEMMRHDVMYIGYMSDCAEIPEDERYCSSMLLLNKFHEQYLYYTNLKN